MAVLSCFWAAFSNGQFGCHLIVACCPLSLSQHPRRVMSSAAPSGSIIFHWLERIGLGYSIPTFQAMGITTPQSLMSLTVEDYDAGALRADEC